LYPLTILTTKMFDFCSLPHFVIRSQVCRLIKK
jgi:hypothetical protein